MRETSDGKKGLSGSTLKLIAVFSMFIDHVGAGILGRYLMCHGVAIISWSQVNWIQQFFGGGNLGFSIYLIMRLFGRLAFPIYCFLLAEGFCHTKNRWKYAGRLFLFALLSEIPFDLVFRGRWLESSYQNVMFTLLVGFFCMMLYETAEKRWQDQPWLRMLSFVAVAFLGTTVTVRLHTDYEQVGVLAILMMYMLRSQKIFQILSGCVLFAYEYTAPLAFLPIALYNGKRGLKMKYFFYAFYPAHLLLIFAACVWLGLINLMSVF